MTDRELLELAAKAAGYQYDPTKEGDELGRLYSEHLGLWIWHWKDWFNPLEDDGDALRLAVRLGFMDSGVGFARVLSELQQMIFPANADPERNYAATRRAIVRAAAEIGKGMK